MALGKRASPKRRFGTGGSGPRAAARRPSGRARRRSSSALGRAGGLRHRAGQAEREGRGARSGGEILRACPQGAKGDRV